MRSTTPTVEDYQKHENSPFSSMQLENYRSRLSKDGENEQLFSEILRKLPSHSSGEKDSLSMDEKQYLLQEIKNTKRGF